MGDTTTAPAQCSSPSSASSPSPSDSSSNSSHAETKRSPPTPRSRKSPSKSQAKPASRSKGKSSHNLIEKRYRNNLNSKIQILRDCIPALSSKRSRSASTSTSEEEEEGGEGEGEIKCNKGTILEKAIQYIAELEREVERLERDNEGLQMMVKAYLPRGVAGRIKF